MNGLEFLTAIAPYAPAAAVIPYGIAWLLWRGWQADRLEHAAAIGRERDERTRERETLWAALGVERDKRIETLRETLEHMGEQTEAMERLTERLTAALAIIPHRAGR